MPPPTAVADDASGSISAATHAKQQAKVDSTTNRSTAPAVRMPSFAALQPKFADKYEEREYLKGRLATAFRIFGKLGFEEGVAGHITVRDPVHPNQFWVNPMGKAFRLMRRSDLLLINEHGEVVEGGATPIPNPPAYMTHHAVHTARPDVLCAAHSHSLYGRAFATLGRNLDITTQDSCAFYNVSVRAARPRRRPADQRRRTSHTTPPSTASSSPRRRAGTTPRPWATRRTSSSPTTAC